MRQGGGQVASGVVSTAQRTVLASAALLTLVLGLGLASCSDDAGPNAGATTSTAPRPIDDGGEVDATSSDDPVVAGDGPAADVEPVALDATTDFANGVAIRLSAIESVTVEATLPGEISGPGVSISIEITNGSGDPIDLDHVTVDLTDASGASASPVTTPEAPGLSDHLAPGESTTGRYLFTLPLEDRADASLRVSYTTSAPTVLFTGTLPDA